MARPVKIAHVCAIPSSIKYLLADQLTYFQDLGYEVHSITSPGSDQDFVEALGPWHPATISRALTPGDDLRGIWEVSQICRREGFDLVHTHTPKAILIGSMGARLARVPAVGQTLHGLYYAGIDPSVRRSVFRLVEVALCRQADFVLSQSAEDMALIERERLCDLSKVTHLDNGIDVERFALPPFGPEELRDRRAALGLNPDGPVVGIVGRYVVEKGYRELCEAVRMLADEFPTLNVLAVGTNPAQERPHELVEPQKDAVVGDRFVCLYDRADMEDLYRLMDLFVLPSWREGLPRAPMEACASGIPVITTRVRGCREVVEDGVNGLLIDARSGPQLADAIRKLLNDDALRAELVEGGHAKARSRFDQRLGFERTRRVYETMLRARGIEPPA